MPVFRHKLVSSKPQEVARATNDLLAAFAASSAVHNVWSKMVVAKNRGKHKVLLSKYLQLSGRPVTPLSFGRNRAPAMPLTCISPLRPVVDAGTVAPFPIRCGRSG